MKIPKMLYGTGAEVLPKARSFVAKSLKTGKVPLIPDTDLKDLSGVRESEVIPKILLDPAS